MSFRTNLLNRANEIISNERVDSYGEPEDNFSKIANYWSEYLGVNISPKDVGIMMAFLKIARIQTGEHKVDNYIDLVGYTACAYELAENENLFKKYS